MQPTLRDLLTRGVRTEWFEAVAIVQELLKRLLDAAPESGPKVPDLHEIVLREDGSVDVTGEGPKEQAPVFRAGEVLLALVGDRVMPVPLRLVALTAVSPTPTYATLQDLTSALDYYERPDRLGIVRGVCARYAQLPAPQEEPKPVGEILPSPQPPLAMPVVPWWRQKRSIMAASLALALVVLGLSAWALFHWKSQWVAASSAQAASLARTATSTVAGAVKSGVEAIRTQFGDAPAAPAVESAPPPPAPAAAKPLRAFLHSTKGWAGAGGQMPAGGLVAPTVPATRPIDPASVAPDITPVPRLDVEAGQWTIYSSANTDVVPPVAVHAKVPSEPPPGVEIDTLPAFELVVSATGEVESVRLRGGASDVRASMMVSAIKAWRFEPAKRNGRPVRYRCVVLWTGQ